jgi:hypothetical protein
MSDSVILTLLPDGSLQLTGGTFKHKDAIKAVGGKWNKDTKAWTVPFDADLSFLPSAPAAAPVAAPVAPVVYAVVPPAHKPREEWTAAEWWEYVRLNRRRGFIGRCCSHARALWDYGPINYDCEKHGLTTSDYAGT